MVSAKDKQNLGSFGKKLQKKTDKPSKNVKNHTNKRKVTVKSDHKVVQSHYNLRKRPRCDGYSAFRKLCHFPRTLPDSNQLNSPEFKY